jgi:hypothetical protein
VAQRLGDQGGHVGVEEPVDHVTPAAIADDKPQIAEDPQLMRDGRLLHLDLGAELTDRARTLHQPGQYLDPACGRESPHQSCHFLCRHAAQRKLHGPVVGGTHVRMLTCACIHVNRWGARHHLDRNHTFRLAWLAIGTMIPQRETG